jgi:hypothetical protein
MKIRPVGAELFHVDWWTDRQADMTKKIGAFRNFANVPKKDHNIALTLSSLCWNNYKS